jgi:RNA polymerase sigma-70 factor (ECF subfamily)
LPLRASLPTIGEIAAAETHVNDIASLVEPHIPALRRYAWALLRDDQAADDLVQDCLERAVSRWQLRRRDGNLRAWLFAILHNRFISDRRTQTRRGPHGPLDEMTAPPLAAGDPEQAAASRDVLGALAALPEEQRAVILLVGVEDLSYEEAARALGVPIGTVMSRLSRGRERLRRYLDGERPAALRRVK